jgi:hypothetical protein
MLHGSSAGRKPWSGLLPALALLLSSVLGALVAGLVPAAGQTQVAVVTAPWWGLMRTVEMIGAADGTILDAGGLPNVVIAHSDDPGFVDALYRAGAWLVLDPVLLRGCLAAGRNDASRPAEGAV